MLTWNKITEAVATIIGEFRIEGKADGAVYFTFPDLKNEGWQGWPTGALRVRNEYIREAPVNEDDETPTVYKDVLVVELMHGTSTFISDEKELAEALKSHRARFLA